MVEWRSRFRKSTAASLIGLAGLAAAVLPAAPGHGDAVEPYLYTCKGDLVDKTLPVAITVPESVPVGHAMVVQWSLPRQRMRSPGDFPTGGHVAMSGTVRMAGLWDGEATLNSVGVRSHDTVRGNTRIEMPEVLEGRFAVPVEGDLWVKPGPLVLDFVPAETIVNDTSEEITYSEGDWLYFGNRRATPRSAADHEQDVHASLEKGATAAIEFVGTGIDYLTERDDDMGKVRIRLDDGDPVVKDASLDAGGVPLPPDRKLGRQVLFSVRGLPYGKHRLQVEHASPGRWLMVDAFRIVAETASTAAETPYRVICTPPADAELLKVSVRRVVPPSRSPAPAAKGLAAVDDLGVAAAGQVAATPKGAPQTGSAPRHALLPLALTGAGGILVLTAALLFVLYRVRRARYA